MERQLELLEQAARLAPRRRHPDAGREGVADARAALAAARGARRRRRADRAGTRRDLPHRHRHPETGRQGIAAARAALQEARRAAAADDLPTTRTGRHGRRGLKSTPPRVGSPHA